MECLHKSLAILFLCVLIRGVGTESRAVHFIPLQVTAWFYKLFEPSACILQQYSHSHRRKPTQHADQILEQWHWIRVSNDEPKSANMNDVKLPNYIVGKVSEDIHDVE